MVQEELNAISARIAGCETVAFVDLSTRMSLVTNDTSPESQDTLTDLTAEAALALASGHTALICLAQNNHLFLKSTTEPNDALCCILNPSTDLSTALGELRSCLAKISEDGAGA